MTSERKINQVTGAAQLPGWDSWAENRAASLEPGPRRLRGPWAYRHCRPARGTFLFLAIRGSWVSVGGEFGNMLQFFLCCDPFVGVFSQRDVGAQLFGRLRIFPLLG